MDDQERVTDFLPAVNLVFYLEMRNATLDGAEQLVRGEADRGDVVRPMEQNIDWRLFLTPVKIGQIIMQVKFDCPLKR